MSLHSILLVFLVSQAVFAVRYSDKEAREKLEKAGIKIVSSGNCNDQQNAHCTSLEGVHSEVIDGTDGIISFKRNSGCGITITGGTEVGHASGTYSHYNGWKLDVAIDSCVTGYIEKHFENLHDSHYKQPGSGYIFYDENNHWDCCFNKGCAT